MTNMTPGEVRETIQKLLLEVSRIEVGPNDELVTKIYKFFESLREK